jgi:hypothetical protein
VGFYFAQIADRYVDGSAQINCEISVSFASSVAQPDDLSAQRSILRISSQDARGHLIDG